MSARLFALILGAALAVQSTAALADNCWIVNMQNKAATDKYNAAWKDFNASFAHDLPALRQHAKDMYPAWSKLGAASAPAFHQGMQELADGAYQGDKPANFLSRRCEEQLNAQGKDKAFLASFFPNVKDEQQRKRNWKTLDIRVSARQAPDGSYIARGSDNEPYFEICMDEIKPIPAGMSFICGPVTRFDSPDEASFIDYYVENVRSSRVTNGSGDLQKPTAAVCGKLPAGSPTTDEDASSSKTTDGSGDDGGAATGSTQPDGGATNINK